jgi:hypothetical protein
MKCRIALVSFPPKKARDSNYLILGEIYDSSIKTHKNLSIMANEIKYLTPFRIKKDNLSLSNCEDVAYFTRKYKMTSKVITTSNSEVFLSPQLYDITCNKPVFEYSVKEPLPKPIKDVQQVFIFICPTNPVIRGLLIDSCLKITNECYFYLCGGIYKNNQDRLSTLACKYLLTRNFPRDRILKYDKFNLDNILYMAHNALNVFTITIACDSSIISKILKMVRIYRRTNNIEKINFITEYYDKDRPI